MKTIFLVATIFICAFFFSTPAFAYRTADPGQRASFLGDVVSPTGIATDSVQTKIGSLIAGALTLTGTIFLGLMVYGGFLWMTAKGEEEPITKAKNTIFAAIIGLAIVVGAYAITNIVTKLTTNSGNTASGNSTDNQFVLCEQNYTQCVNTCSKENESDPDRLETCSDNCYRALDLCKAPIIRQMEVNRTQNCESLKRTIEADCANLEDALEQGSCFEQAAYTYNTCLR